MPLLHRVVLVTRDIRAVEYGACETYLVQSHLQQDRELFLGDAGPAGNVHYLRLGPLSLRVHCPGSGLVRHMLNLLVCQSVKG